MSQATISELDYRRLSDFIHSEWGLEFPSNKRVLVETRLGKRARALGLDSLAAYCEYLHSPQGRTSEAGHLVDAITTHKTDFFREPSHFEHLTGSIVPEMAAADGVGTRRPLSVWSSASSTGQEAYTIAIVLAEYARSVEPKPFRFEITATDISTVVLDIGRTAVYTQESVGPIPETLRRRYLLRSRDRTVAKVRICPALRERVQFQQLNLLDADYRFPAPFDVVFCRNVMIYFDRPTQLRVLRQICRVLRVGGYLLMGHAESLNGLELPLVQATPTVHRRLHD